MSNSEEEVTNVCIFRKKACKLLKIKNIEELEPGEKISFDVDLDNNIYILTIGILNNPNAPYIYFSIEPPKESVKRNVTFKVIMKDIGNRPFLQASELIKQNTPFSCQSKYTRRDLPARCLIIDCELSCISWTKEDMPQKENTISFTQTENLLRDLNRLYTDGTNADVEIHVGKTVIPVHSQILSARSEVFAAMFRHDMAEKLNKTIDILDINAMAMHYFLNFIYTGKLDENAGFRPDTLKQLYTVADKYAVLELKEMVSDILLSNMSPDNLTSCAYLGFTHCDQRMQEEVVKFISRGMAILDSKQWRELEETAPVVAAEVVKNVLEAQTRQ